MCGEDGQKSPRAVEGDSCPLVLECCGFGGNKQSQSRDNITQTESGSRRHGTSSRGCCPLRPQLLWEESPGQASENLLGYFREMAQFCPEKAGRHGSTASPLVPTQPMGAGTAPGS